MLSVALPPSLPLHLVVRTPDIYIVPRTSGPNAGRAIIGATIEDAGFDKTVHPSDIAHLRSLAAALLPPLADAPQLEAWAGLRPATPDGLPLLGALPAPAQPLHRHRPLPRRHPPRPRHRTRHGPTSLQRIPLHRPHTLLPHPTYANHKEAVILTERAHRHRPVKWTHLAIPLSRRERHPSTCNPISALHAELAPRKPHNTLVAQSHRYSRSPP